MSEPLRNLVQPCRHGLMQQPERATMGSMVIQIKDAFDVAGEHAHHKAGLQPG